MRADIKPMALLPLPKLVHPTRAGLQLCECFGVRFGEQSQVHITDARWRRTVLRVESCAWDHYRVRGVPDKSWRKGEGSDLKPLENPLVSNPEGQRKAAGEFVQMGGLFDLEKQFSFYGSYHTDHTNVLIHMVCVWPIYYSVVLFFAYTPAFTALPLAGGTFPLQEYAVLNFSFVTTLIYAGFYILLDKKAGSLAAFLCFGGWIGANAIAQSLDFTVGWKIVLVVQLFGWIAQFVGHGVFEKRAPALLDNLSQALLMAPFFVLLEVLATVGYEPYPGFMSKVDAKVKANVAKFRDSRLKSE